MFVHMYVIFLLLIIPPSFGLFLEMISMVRNRETEVTTNVIFFLNMYFVYDYLQQLILLPYYN